MTDKKKDVNIDPSADTVIGMEGSKLHHDLKNNPGEKGDPDHTEDNDDAKDEEE